MDFVRIATLLVNLLKVEVKVESGEKQSSQNNRFAPLAQSVEQCFCKA